MNILRFQDGGQTPDVRVFTKEYFNKDNKIGLVGTQNQFDGKYIISFYFVNFYLHHAQNYKVSQVHNCTAT